MARAKSTPIRAGPQILEHALRQPERQPDLMIHVPTRTATHARSVPEVSQTRRRPGCAPAVFHTTSYIEVIWGGFFINAYDAIGVQSARNTVQDGILNSQYSA